MTDTQQAPTTPTQTPKPVVAPALPYSFKANLSEYRKRFGMWRIGLAFLLTLIILVRFGFVPWLISIAAVALLIGAILFVMVSRRVTIHSDAIEYQGLFWRTKKLRFDEIEDAKVFINHHDAGFGVAPRVSIAQKGGSPIVLNGIYWSVEELDKLLAVLAQKNIKTDYYEDVANYAAIAQQFPNHAMYYERKPALVAVITLVVIVVIVAAISLWATFG